MIIKIPAWIFLLILVLIWLLPAGAPPFFLLKLAGICLPLLWVYSIGNSGYSALKTEERNSKRLFFLAGRLFCLLPLIDYLLIDVWNDPATTLLANTICVILMGVCFAHVSYFSASVLTAWERGADIKSSLINTFLLLFFFPAGMLLLSGRLRRVLKIQEERDA